MRIKAIAFDVDGTLYPNNIMYRKSVPFALAHPRLLLSYGRVRRRIREIRPIEDFRSLQADLLAKEMGVSVATAADLVERLIYRRWELVLKKTPLFPGLRELLDSLLERGYPLGVLSDFPVERKLEYLGLARYWKCALSAEESGYLKPNPEPFRRLADCLGLPPEQILYVGNSYSYDVLGAKKVGMPVAHLSARPEPDTAADLTFADYPALKSWIESKIGADCLS